LVLLFSKVDLTSDGRVLASRCHWVLSIPYEQTKSHHKICLFVSYGYEVSSLTIREERRLRVFESRVLWRIFEPVREEVTGGWRNLYSEELLNCYSSLNTGRVIKSRRVR
jgi:hypothetical protein